MMSFWNLHKTKWRHECRHGKKLSIILWKVDCCFYVLFIHCWRLGIQTGVMQLDESCVCSSKYPVTSAASLKQQLFRISDYIKDLQIIWHSSREKQTDKVREDCWLHFSGRKKKWHSVIFLLYHHFSQEHLIFFHFYHLILKGHC